MCRYNFISAIMLPDWSSLASRPPICPRVGWCPHRTSAKTSIKVAKTDVFRFFKVFFLQSIERENLIRRRSFGDVFRGHIDGDATLAGLEIYLVSRDSIAMPSYLRWHLPLIYHLPVLRLHLHRNCSPPSKALIFSFFLRPRAAFIA